MSYQHIIVETRGRVGVIRLNRPAALNALNLALMNEVAAPEKGKVAELACENGEPVEFEQVLMYLEPVE